MPKDNKSESARKWLDAIKCVENDTDNKSWIERGKKIVRRYRDERSLLEIGAKFNILYSNTETIFPAIYSRTPKAEVSRRNKDADPIARTASRILERALQYEIDQYPDFNDSMRAAVQDRLLPGRGTVWIRFEEYEVARPAADETVDALELANRQIEDTVVSGGSASPADAPVSEQSLNIQGQPIADMGMMSQGQQMAPQGMPGLGMGGGFGLTNRDALIAEDEQEAETPEVKEHACVDYVYWEDFRHGQARTWADVPWVARRVYMTKDEIIERFGDEFRDVPLTQEPIGVDDEMRKSGSLDELKKAAVWEIWDMPSKTAIWVAEGYPKTLDTKDDPYGLEGFFPCPKPLFATQTTDQITPIPDFAIYQDQANELDLLTARISGLVGALRLNGAYDSATPELARILSSDDNTLIPVENWAVLSEKGGVAGAIQWVPIREVVGALTAAYTAREQVKQVIYEITGISDIIRGATKASETFGAQEIKRQFGTLRLQTRQRDVAQFATDILRIKAQLMMDVYSPETLIAMSGIMDTDDGQYADAAMQLLQTEPLREYQIAVASDSLVAMDEEQEKASRMEFLTSIGGYIERAMQAAESVPEIAPLAMELMMFAVRAFPAAKPIEGAFEEFQTAMENRQEQDPNAAQQAEQQQQQQAMQAEMQLEQAKMQQTMQIEQMKLQMQQQTDQARIQADVQIKQAQAQMQMQLESERANRQMEVDQNRAAMEMQQNERVEMLKLEFERWKVELQEATKIQIAGMASAAKGVIQIDPATQTATNEISTEITQ